MEVVDTALNYLLKELLTKATTRLTKNQRKSIKNNTETAVRINLAEDAGWVSAMARNSKKAVQEEEEELACENQWRVYS